MNLYHGGARGLWRGDEILPGMDRHVDGCPCCEARRSGITTIDPPTPDGWVYASKSRLYARYYASLAVAGDLYRVELLGDVERSVEDHFPTWRASRARVLQVIERGITMTMYERRRLFRAWGGTDAEFEAMVRSTAAAFSQEAAIARALGGAR